MLNILQYSAKIPAIYQDACTYMYQIEPDWGPIS